MSQNVDQAKMEELAKWLNPTDKKVKFFENKGQLPNSVLAYGQLSTGYLYIESTGLKFISLSEIENETNENGGVTVATDNGDDPKEKDENPFFHRQVWGIEFNGLPISVSNLEFGEAFNTKYNYFLDPDPAKCASNVLTYSELIIQNVYDGIDLRLYSKDNGYLEFDWLIDNPNHYSNIQMTFKGVNSVTLIESGELEINVNDQSFKLNIPESYQIIDDKKVLKNVNFVKKEEFVFSYGTSDELDETKPLIIDPNLIWGTYFDGTGPTSSDNGFDGYLLGIVEDHEGDFYCVGYIKTPLNSIYTGTYGYSSVQAANDAVVYKIKSDATELIFLTFFGGSDMDYGYGIDIGEDDGSVFVCGETESSLAALSPAYVSNTAFDGAHSSSELWEWYMFLQKT